MSKFSGVSGGKAPQVSLRMARAELLLFYRNLIFHFWTYYSGTCYTDVKQKTRTAEVNG